MLCGCLSAAPATVCPGAIALRVSQPWERCSSPSASHFRVREVGGIWLPSLGTGGRHRRRQTGCQAARARGGGLPGMVLHLTHPPSQLIVSATLCLGWAT